MNHKLLFLASLGLLAPLSAQEASVLPQPSPRERVIFILPAKAEKDRPIEIAEAAVHTRLAGPLAETTVTLVFHNPNSRDMEGELSYPLPPDATLQGYALDVNGKMVDGVPVPKQKARVAFEEEQRQGIDPGLAEWSGGNRFKTRVSPIPAHGQRTIRLRYTTMVQQHASGSSYRLPLDFERVGRFRLRMEALTPEQPQVQASGLGTLSFAPWQQYFVLEREWKDLALREDLVVDLPQGMAEAPAVEKQGEQFYLAKLITPPQGQQATLPKTGFIDLIWDTSASMEKVDKAPIFEALRLYLEQNPDCIVRLTFVGDTLRPAPEWRDHAKLLEALKQTSYDGATTDISLALTRESDMCLLVTDGQVNFAEQAEPAAAEQGKGLIYAFVASSGVDKAALRRWGAIPIDLLRQTPAEALAHVPSVQLAGIELDGKPWEGALTNAPAGVVDGALLLTGVLPAGKHEVCAVFRSAEGEQRVSFSVDTAEAVEGQLNRSFHAQNKLASLLLEPESPAREMLLRQLGEEYGIVTPGTSLLVLENMEQYLRHEVRPPACCPELRERYDASIALRAKLNAERKEAALKQQKQNALNERMHVRAWYEQDYSKPKPPPVALARETHPDAEVNRLLELGYGYYDLGKVDEAFDAFNRALALESDCEAARRGMEACSSRRAAEYREAHDSHRSRALTGVALEENAEHMRRASRADGASNVAPVVVVSTGAAPVSMAAVTIEVDDTEAEEDEDSFSEPPAAPAPAPVVMAPVEGGTAAPVLMARESSAAAAPAAGSPAIRLQAWSSNAPYLAVLKAAADPVAAYREQRRQNATSPGFYLDCADFFEQAGDRAMAVRVLSNLLEMELENRSLMRAAACKLRFMGELKAAIALLRKVQELFPEEPQSHRDLALALADAGRWQEAADEMRKVLELPMDARFYGMEQIAINELAHIVARAQQEGKPVKVEGVDASCLKPLELDLRVVINWDTDMSDMDLWVTDPRREKCYYAHKYTRTGGCISRDVTQGYGPEEFLIRKALPGDYKVEAHYYGSRSMKMLAPVTLYAEVYTDYGRPTEKRQTLVFRLDGRDQVVHIADIAHTPDASPTTRDYQVRAGESWASIAEKELGSAERAADIISLNPGARADVPPPTGCIIRLPKH